MKVSGDAFTEWRRYFALALALMASLAIGGMGRSAEAADGLSVEAEHMAGGGKTYAAPSASNDKARLLYENSGISRKVSGSIARVGVRAKGDPCEGAPQMEIMVDGRTVKTSLVRSRKAWTQYSADVETAGGTRDLYRLRQRSLYAEVRPQPARRQAAFRAHRRTGPGATCPKCPRPQPVPGRAVLR